MSAAASYYTPSPWGNTYHLLNHNEALGGGSAGPGKALWIETPILTTRGWKKMGDLQVGDMVFNEQGMSCVVLGCSQVMYGHECYVVGFEDGTEIVADEEHVWVTMTSAERASLRSQEKKKRQRKHVGLDQRRKCLLPQRRDTKQILGTLMVRGKVNHSVTVTRPIQMPSVELPVHPYTLGAWLGDGSAGGGQITSMDDHIVARAALCGGFMVRHLPKSSKNTGKASLWSLYGLTTALRSAGVLGDKHIPESYLLASEVQRLEILKGLVDTDGHVDCDGRVELTLCNKKLAESAHRLVATLGFKSTFAIGRAKIRGVDCGERYRLCFSPMGREVASLPRKIVRLGNGSRTQRWRYITSVSPTKSVPVRCIYVDTPSHLYLAGHQLVPTHNTSCLLMDPMAQVSVEHERCMNPEHPYHQPWGSSVGHAIFLRRTHPNLHDVVKRAHRIFTAIDPSVRWNENKHTFTFRSGFIYQFGACHDSNDWTNYLGTEFSWIGWDELITFEEEQYDQVNARLRSFDPVLRKMLKIRAMSNPMMSRGQNENFSIKDPNWVRRRFVDPAPDGKTTLVKKIRMDDGTTEEWTSIYMPAYLSDNPDPEFRRVYEINLQQKKPHIRQALLRGDWYVTEGSFYGEVWNPQLHIRKPFRIPKEWPKFRSMDWGFKTPGCVHWWAMDTDGNLFCFREMMFQGMHAGDVAKAILQIEKGMGLTKNGKSMLNGPADTNLWMTTGDTTMGKAQEMAAEGVLWVPAKKGAGSRLRNAELLYDRLADHESGTTTPGVVFFTTCPEVVNLIPAMQTDKDNSESPADGNDEHACDSAFYAMGYASHGKSGLNWKYLDADDDDEEKDKKPKKSSGRHWGYGT